MDNNLILPLDLVFLNGDALWATARMRKDVGELVNGDVEGTAIKRDEAEFLAWLTIHPNERVVESAFGSWAR